MGLFGGLSPANFIPQVALGMATGGTSLLVSQIVQQVVSRMLQEVVQTVGQQMGLPQSMIDMAQGAAAGSVGDFRGAALNYGEAAQSAAGMASDFIAQAGGSLVEQGQAASQVESWKDGLLDRIMEDGKIDEDGNPRGGRAAGGKQSWLMTLAEALGNKLDQAADELQQKMDSTDWEDPKASTEFQASAQEFNLFMNTASNVMKTVGEALATMGRKQ